MPRKPSERPRPDAPRADGGEAGFTLIEALVALAVAAVCLAAIGTLMAQNRRAVRAVEQRVALASALRKVEAALPDRAQFAGAELSGEMAGMQWRIASAPYPDPAVPAFNNPSEWAPQAVSIKLRSPSGVVVEIDALRLAPRKQP